MLNPETATLPETPPPPAASPPAPLLLEAEAVRVQFGKLAAVQGVSLALGAGHLLGLIGPNGAGKTTLLRAMAGLQPLVSGRVRVLGEALLPGERVMQTIGFTPDTPPLYEEMTVRTFLRFVAKGYGLGAREVDERIGYWLERVWLVEKAEQKIKGLSRGMRQRVGIARTLLPNPAVVLLDEPAAGLDPAGRVQFRRLLCELRDQGKALVVSSHILSDMEEYCTHIAIMGHGTLLRYGTVGEVVAGEPAGADAGGGAGPAVCRYDVTLARTVPDLRKLVQGIPGVGAITTDPPAAGNGDPNASVNRLSIEFARGRDEAARLLAELVTRGVPVASFAPEPIDLEQAYLRAGVRQVE